MATGYRTCFGGRLILTGLTFLTTRALSARFPPILTVTGQRRGLRSAPGEAAGGQDWLAGRTPQHLASELLSPLADRWAHSEMAAAQARRVAATVPARDRDLLIAAAWLHDIGYAAQLTDTGFHPLDGARYLRVMGAPMRLAALVAHHSEAGLLAGAQGVLDQLQEFPREHGPISDALAYADMTAGPTGQRMAVADRLADIRVRHAAEPPRLKAARLSREPLLTAAAARVERRMARTR